jgi:subtilisin family serine protease
MMASDYASAFHSKIYPGRHVPDFCGLVGMAANHAEYIMLPIQPGCSIDTDESATDETASDDGWGVFSGTSAAAPQVAGACALMLQVDPGLTPDDIKQILQRNCRDVTLGSANPASNENNGGMPAGFGDDGATGSGLLDVYAALRQL